MLRHEKILNKRRRVFLQMGGLSALGTDVVLDSGDYTALLDKALVKIGWEALQRECKGRRARGDAVGLGL